MMTAHFVPIQPATAQPPPGMTGHGLIEHYLDDMRNHLAGLPTDQSEDILLELHSHLCEKSALCGEAAAIAALGEAKDLADEFLGR